MMIDPIEDLKMWEEAMRERKLKISQPLDPAIIEIDRLNRELEAAAAYIEENEVLHKKFKKNIPTVIEYQGRRYVLDDRS
jgi:hypothetical protein